MRSSLVGSAVFFLSLLLEASAKPSRQCRLRPKSGILTAQVPVAAPTSPASSSNGSGGGGGSGTRTATASTGTPTPTLPTFDYANKKVIGVNLGGWFVLEPWIVPSIFINTNNTSIVDEYTFGQMQDPDVALAALTDHWNTWMTEDDFVTMAAAGINHVRIPLGYWSIPTGESVHPYTPGAWPFFLQALTWAHKHGIYTIVDLHGAPGSQNGYDNSGQATGNPQWALVPADVTRTINDLVYLANNTRGLVDVLELLNESGGFISDQWVATTRQFFQDAYNAVRAAVGNNLKIMIGDAFKTVDSWQGFLTQSDGGIGVMMDFHQYQIFSVGELQRSMDEHISVACGMIPDIRNFAQHNLWTVMGEWSAASTDCAKWLNGRNVGARWDGTYSQPNSPLGTCSNMTGDSSNWSNDYKTFLRKYWEVQSVMGDSVQGNVFWTWKAEDADEWNYSKGLKEGWIPQDPTERLYPNICG